MNTLLFVLLGVVGVVVAVAILWRPAIGAALLLALVHFERVFMFGGLSLVKLVSLLCLGILVLRVLVSRKGIRFDVTTALILLLVMWIAVTSLWSTDQSGILSDLLSLLLQSSMYFLLINLVWSKEDLKLALWGYLLGGTVLAVILGNTMIGQNLERSTDMVFAGMGINLVSRMVGLNLLIAVILTQLETGRLAKIVLIAAAIISGVSSILALSRGNWYGLGLSALIVILVMGLKNRLQFTVKQVAVLLLVGYVAFYAASTFILTDHGTSKLGERFESAYTFSDNASGRFDIWRAAWKPFTEQPLLGHGYNSFKRQTQWQYAGAHSAYVLIAVEDGLIGLMLFFLILGSVFVRLWYLLMEKNANPVALAWGMALLVFLMTVSAVDTAVNRKYLWFGLGLISLLVHYYGLNEPVEETAEEPKVVKRLGTAEQLT